MPPEMPYTWLNPILAGGSGFLILSALVLVVFSFVSRSFSKRRLRQTALRSFLVGVILGASLYALIFLVQLPSWAKQVREAERDRVDTAALVKVGQSAPAFRIKAPDGTEIATAALRGKVVLLNFFETSCEPCLRELPHLQEIWNTYRDRADFSMLVIAREESDETVTEFKMKHGYSLPMMADPERTVYSLYAKELIPRTYLISKDGTISLARHGYDEHRLNDLKRDLAKQLGSSK
jgi:peroxiredoxin